MQNGTPSRTALITAAARAAHLVVDHQPHLFHDTVAASLLGTQAEELIGYHRKFGEHLILSGARAQVTVRSHYTEARLAASGHTQYVTLGADLDTFAYRIGGDVAVFEVDHPGTQRWKRDLLADAGIATIGVEFVGVDFENDCLAEQLATHSFDPARPALVSWLGVSMYLTAPAIAATLAVLGRCAPGTELIMEYALPAHLLDERGVTYASHALTATADLSEPWHSYFAPEELSAMLDTHGFTVQEHRSQREAVPPALWQRTDGLRPVDLCRLVRAKVRNR
ncbi:class I SAM-dependent methyltransferase [Nocardia xishanensis]